MNPWLVAGVWGLVTLDCALMGYRLAMGRSALLDKRRAHRSAASRAAIAGQIPLALVVLVAAVLAGRGGPVVGSALDDAMRRFIAVGGSYAALILGTWAFCALRSVAVRTVASVLVFGPFTLLRPLVVILTVVIAVGTDPSAELVVLGLLVVAPGIGLEPVLDRRIAQQILSP